MSLNEQSRLALIKYRTEQAKYSIEEVKFLIESNRMILAVNRIYYGMFYMLTSLALLHKFETSKHQQLIGWFNKTFVKTGIFDKRYAKIITDAFEKRTEGDYDAFVVFEKDLVTQMLNNRQDFIQTLDKSIINSMNNNIIN